MAKKILEVGVKAFIKNGSGQYLILHRAKPYHGQKIRKWDIPGGRISAGEPIKRALRREIREETGLKLSRIKNILAVQDIIRNPTYHTVRITFLAEAEGEARVNPQEHSEFRWMSIKSLKKLRYDKYLTPVLGALPK